MKVLVTGGAGFIGSFIVDELVRRGHEVTVFDNLTEQVHPGGVLPPYLNAHARFVRGDVRDYDALRAVVCEAEAIFHKAAAVGVGQSQYEIKRYVDINTGGTANLLDILVNHPHRTQKLIVAASMSSYGEGMYRCESCEIVRPALRPESQMATGDWAPRCPCCQTPVEPMATSEEARQNSNSIYALTKQDQEAMTLNIGQTYGIPTVALRYFNVYGPRQSLSNPYTGVMAIFMSRLLHDRPPVVYEDGLQTRDFISVHDIVRANMLALERPEANDQTFNVGSGVPITIRGVAEVAATYAGKDIAPEITGKFRKGDVRHCYADMSRIRERLGFVPQTSFEEGMREIAVWSRSVESEDRFDVATAELKAKGLV